MSVFKKSDLIDMIHMYLMILIISTIIPIIKYGMPTPTHPDRSVDLLIFSILFIWLPLVLIQFRILFNIFESCKIKND